MDAPDIGVSHSDHDVTKTPNILDRDSESRDDEGDGPELAGARNWKKLYGVLL